MGKDYHRDSPDSIPILTESRQKRPQTPPQGHYAAESGQWDGQLPNADIADQVAEPQEVQGPTWPSILQRMEWTRETIRAHTLPPPQAAVLNEVAYRDGRGLGCTATMATIALDTGYNEKSIRTAIKKLEGRGIIIGHGGAGQKKMLGLPFRNGKLYSPTPVTSSGVEDSAEATTPVTGSGVNNEEQCPTPVTGTGIEANPGNRFRATPVTGSDITGSKQAKRVDIYNNSLSHHSSSSSAVRGSEVPTSDIEKIVEANWPLLNESGWEHLGGAINHYQKFGLDYLRRDLQQKHAHLEKVKLAARTCVHCRTVHETADQVKPCIRCEDLICVSDRMSCQQNPCHRQSGPKSKGRPPDWLRR